MGYPAPVMADRVRFEDADLDSTNVLRKMAEERNVPELNHGHTSGFSDGSSNIGDRIYEAARLGVPYLGFTDHGDVTGISGRDIGYYGEEAFRDPALFREAIRQHLISEDVGEYPMEHETFDVHLALGMEINYDPENEELIREYIEDHDLDYALLSVHHDRDGRNFGHDSVFPNGVDTEALTEEYFNLLGQAAELAHDIPEIKAIAHPDRIETNPIFVHDVRPEMYADFFDDLDGYDVLPELNAKTRVRNIEYGFSPTIGSEILRKHGTPFSGGTDTHRVGKSDKISYNPNETERRLQELEEIAEENNLQTILEDTELPSLTVKVDERLQQPNFRDIEERPQLTG